MNDHRPRRGSSTLVLACVLGASAAFSSAALAETPERYRQQPVIYEFRDADRLGGDGSSPYGSLLEQRPIKPLRVLLIRPRQNFVPELLKSIEKI